MTIFLAQVHRASSSFNNHTLSSDCVFNIFLFKVKFLPKLTQDKYFNLYTLLNQPRVSTSKYIALFAGVFNGKFCVISQLCVGVQKKPHESQL